jgi:multiple antibiotic resistance protein
MSFSAFVTLLLVVDRLRLCPRSSRHRKTAPRTDIIALRTPSIASAIMIGLALFGNWLLHQLGVGLAEFQIA